MNITFSDSAYDDLQNIQLYYHERGVSEVGQRYVCYRDYRTCSDII